MFMKIISYNVRGLRGWDKIREVQRLVRERCSTVVCIQETKFEGIDEFVCRSLSGSTVVGFSYRSSVGTSRGILTLWNPSKVDVWVTMSMENY